jgi:type II secretory pathway pseudopilin PulG
MCRHEPVLGFTLVEIMIAITFLSLVALGVGQALVTGQRTSRQLGEDATILASCQDLMRQFGGMTAADIAAQDGTPFTVGGVNGSGTVSVTNPYLGSDDIAHVVLSWDGVPVLQCAFGDAAMAAVGESGGGGGGTPSEPQWHDGTYSQTSPNYPSNYSNNYDHTWTITETGAEKMRVHFNDFRTYDSNDRVYIKDGSGTTITSYYGNKGAFTSAEVNGDTIRIRFSTNGWNSQRGWRIDKYEYYK